MINEDAFIDELLISFLKEKQRSYLGKRLPYPKDLGVPKLYSLNKVHFSFDSTPSSFSREILYIKMKQGRK